MKNTITVRIADSILIGVNNMDRLTEYHDGKAVIKDKSLLPKAMEKLARYEDMEENRVSAEEFIMKRFTEVR